MARKQQPVNDDLPVGLGLNDPGDMPEDVMQGPGEKKGAAAQAAAPPAESADPKGKWIWKPSDRCWETLQKVDEKYGQDLKTLLGFDLKFWMGKVGSTDTNQNFLKDTLEAVAFGTWTPPHRIYEKTLGGTIENKRACFRIWPNEDGSLGFKTTSPIGYDKTKGTLVVNKIVPGDTVVFRKVEISGIDTAMISETGHLGRLFSFGFTKKDGTTETHRGFLSAMRYDQNILDFADIEDCGNRKGLRTRWNEAFAAGDYSQVTYRAKGCTYVLTSKEAGELLTNCGSVWVKAKEDDSKKICLTYDASQKRLVPCKDLQKTKKTIMAEMSKSEAKEEGRSQSQAHTQGAGIGK